MPAHHLEFETRTFHGVPRTFTEWMKGRKTERKWMEGREEEKNIHPKLVRESDLSRF